jgi:hypothetical protein
VAEKLEQELEKLKLIGTNRMNDDEFDEFDESYKIRNKDDLFNTSGFNFRRLRKTHKPVHTVHKDKPYTYTYYIHKQKTPPFNIRIPDTDRNAFHLLPDKTQAAINIRNKFLISDASPAKYEWIQRQQKYTDSLSERDKTILSSYSYHGDKLINGYCRGNLSNDDIAHLLDADLKSFGVSETTDMLLLAYFLYDQYDLFSKRVELPPKSQLLQVKKPRYTSPMYVCFTKYFTFFTNIRNIATLLEQYKRELIRIISKSPKLTKPLVVYRGFQHEKHITSSTFVNNDFMSTSIDPNVSFNFAEITGVVYGGVYEITIDTNVPCIYLENSTLIRGEFEVLIPPGMTIALDDTIYYKIVLPDSTITEYLVLAGMAEPNVDETKAAIIHATITRPAPKHKKSHYVWHSPPSPSASVGYKIRSTRKHKQRVKSKSKSNTYKHQHVKVKHRRPKPVSLDSLASFSSLDSLSSKNK